MKKELKPMDDIIKKRCPICGRQFVKAVESAWRIGTTEYCSYNCFRKVERKQIEKRNTKGLNYEEMLLRELDIELVKERSKKHGTVMCGKEKYCFHCNMNKFNNTYCCAKAYKELKEKERRTEREKKTQNTKANIKAKNTKTTKI